ncbi:MAG TPA: hypothetical protein DCX31_00090 [Aquificaceae bacterium]|nr:hypothetical protein [Aquificaceae bacterium]
MVSYRGGHTIEKHKVRGIALISALIISVIVLVLLGSLYFMLTRLFETSETTRTYSSAREAAVAGVNYAITSGIFDTIASLGICPDGTPSVNNPRCSVLAGQGGNIQLGCTFNLQFRLKGTNEIYTNRITVCFLGYTQPPGYPLIGVAYSRPMPGNKGNIYSIISEVRDPQGRVTTRIEAVYTP